MKRYYAQLSMVKNRFPMEQNDPYAVPFSWVDRTSDIPTSTTHEDINFELCSVMFNIGAMHAAIAVSETRSELDVSMCTDVKRDNRIPSEHQERIHALPAGRLAAEATSG